MHGYETQLGDANTPAGLRRHLVRRLKGMRGQRMAWEPMWLETARFCEPKISRLLQGTTAVGRVDTMNTKLLDSRAVWASEVLANGMFSGLTSPSRPWFKLKMDGDTGKRQAVKVWVDEVERRIYDLFASTNFYTSVKGGYRELGIYGVEAGIMERHWKHGMVCHPLTAGEYWLGTDEGLACDSLYRRVDMTALQHYRKFLKGREPNAVLPRRVVEAFNRGDYDSLFEVYHAIEPNDTRKPGMMGAKGMEWRSAYWSGVCEDSEVGDEQKALLSQEGFSSKPFWSPRWDIRTSADIYSSTSPGLNTLADVRQLQLQVLRQQQALDYAVKPAMGGPASLQNMHRSLQPSSITAMPNVDKNSFWPLWEVNASVIQAVAQDKQETQAAVDRGFYADLFNAITNMRGIQPRNVEEIAARNEEKLTQLGPVVERVQQEKLEIAIDRAFDILMSSGALADIEMPEELEGQKIEVEFISVLAQAQRLIGLGGIERTFGFAASIAQTHPDALDSLDADAAMAEYGDITGIPAKIMRAQDEIDKIRAARAEAQAQAAQTEQMAAMAPAAKAGAEAAGLLFNSPGVGSSPTLADRLLGTN